jgi:hypothetical protein
VVDDIEPALGDKVVAVDRALTKARVPHAFGGALALAYYAEPRATVDIDVNVFVDVGRAARVAAALEPLGVDPAWADDPRLAEAGQIRTWWGRTPVDVFFAYDDFHEAMARDMRSVPFPGPDGIPVSIPVLGAEHLVACKVIFDRPKDWLDLEQMLVAVRDFDVTEARRWIERIVGEGDSRLTRFDAAVAEFRG